MKETNDKDYFKRLAQQLMFQLSDEEADDIVQEFLVLEQQLQHLDNINTDGVEEMVYPFEDDTYFLRDDSVNHTLSQDEALANVTKKVEGHFLLPKVVK